MTTIQDRGCFHHHWMGVLVSGVIDSFSHRIGNLLLDNNEDGASLEMTVEGPTFRILKDTWIAITGANLIPERNGLHLPMWKTTKVNQGDEISFAYLKEGCRGYLSVRGGISVPRVMGSYSTNARLKIGGIEGRPLRTGDCLESGPFDIGIELKEKFLPTEMIPCYSSDMTLRVILGPQIRYFEREVGVRTFLESQYVVTSHANRMGYRLDGPIIQYKTGAVKSIPSEACCPGAVQIPEDGKPIILLPEQNVGGYIKIAVVISSDLDKLAQLKPGDKIRFEAVSLKEAHQILREKENLIQTWKMVSDSMNSLR